jgi:hypothetical protein
LDASQVTTVGAACGATAACAAPLNFWDGSIDDVYFSGNGATTSSSLSQTQVRKVYLEGRSALSRPSTSFIDATTATSTTIGDSTAAWVPNSFVGEIVEITGGTGAGQTRRIVSNSATVLTVSPTFTTTPDTTSDFEVMPEQLYGGTNTVTAIGLTDNTFLGDSRRVYVGTSDGSDAGGVTLFGGNGVTYVSDVFHSDAGKSDDAAATWSGTDYDDVQSIGSNGTSVSIGSLAHMWTETDELDFQVILDSLVNRINSIRGELVVDGITGTSHEVGIQGGADLAERYYSQETLQAGEVVAIDSSLESGVRKTSTAYQQNVLGVVATQPAIVMGPQAENEYPIALAGRVPVKVTNENGQIYAGDRLTTSSRSGYAMRAIQAGRVVGEVISDAADWVVCEGEDPMNINAKLCTTVMVFVNLTDYTGVPVDLVMQERDINAKNNLDGLKNEGKDQLGLTGENVDIKVAKAEKTKEEKILDFLKEYRDKQQASNAAVSEMFTGRVTASSDIITPTLFADQIFAKRIRADSIEGLQIFTDQISSLSEKYAGLEASSKSDNAQPETSNAVKEQLAIAMKKLSVDSVVVQMDGSILGKLSVTGALRIGGDAEFDGNTIFSKLASFFGNTLFKGNVTFEKAPTFGSDTAGFAVIKKGERKVQVSFDVPYERQPIVAVTLTNDKSPLLDGKADDSLKADVALVEEDYLNKIFDTDVKYIVTEKSENGFTIVLNKKAPDDLQFSWVAVAVKKANITVSDDGTKNDTAQDITAPVSPDPIVPLPISSETGSETPATQPVSPEPTLSPAPDSVSHTTSADINNSDKGSETSSTTESIATTSPTP